MTAPIAKSEFLGLDNCTHLAAGGEAPVLLENLTAVDRFYLDKGIGMPGRDRMAATVSSAKVRLATMLGSSPEEIALLWNATAGLRAIAAGLQCRSGDNIVAGTSEFPSLLSIWHGSAAELRRIGASNCVTLDEIADAVDDHTRAIVISHVSYLTGTRSDLVALREIADRHGARLIVDASHSLGVVSVDGSLCDAIVACCYKWLLGFFVNAKRWPEIKPTIIGWNSVLPEEDWRRRNTFELKPGMEKFESGNLSYMSVYYLDAGLARLEKAGIRAIEGHVLDLGGELRSRLARLNLDLLTPEESDHRAGNICFATDRCTAIEAHLRANGILTWGDDKRLRISVHAYNDAADVERVLDELGRVFA